MCMSTTKRLLWANRVEMSWIDCGGINSWFGCWFSFVSQVSSKSRAFMRSAIGSAIVHHLDGLFAPPKVSFSDMKT